MRRFGLADGVGLVAALVAVAYLPGLADPLTYPKLFALVVGGLALLPAAVLRWRAGWRGWSKPTLIAGGAATALVLWGLISALGSGAPVAVSLFGWWGRGDGWLALFGAVSLLLAAASLTVPEVRRAITWLLGGATVVAFVGILQALGVEITGAGMGGAVTGLMGNTNFAAGYFAIVAALALGRAFMPGPMAERAWAGVLALVLIVLSVLTDAVQGPAALAAGLLALFVLFALGNQGRFRIPLLASAGIVVAAGAGLLVASFAGVGPLTRLWAEETFAIRQQYWQSAWNIMNGLPVFGTGPDGFARYVAEYRPESYVELLGPILRVSAAHNIVLQFGATMGWLAMGLWLAVFVSAGVALLIRSVKPTPGTPVLALAAVGGAFVAYLTQGLVSIDMLPLLATGWTVAGLALAIARTGAPPKVPAASAGPQRGASRKAVAAQVPTTPAWVPLTGGGLALAAAVLVGMQISAAQSAVFVQSQEEAITVLGSGLTPCPPRVNVAQQAATQLPLEISGPAFSSAVAVDQRCSPMIDFQSEIALQQGDLTTASSSTQIGVEIDPLSAGAWILRGQFHLASGDRTAAAADLAEAERIAALYPDASQVAAPLQQLRDALAQ